MAGKKKVIEHPAAKLPQVKIFPVSLSASDRRRRGAQPLIAPYLDPVIDGRFDDGRIPLSLLSAPIKVKITPWPGAEVTVDTVELLLNGTKTGVTETIPNPAAVVTLELDEALFTDEKTYVIDYMTYQTFAQNEDAADAPINVIVDRTAPGSDDIGSMIFDVKHLDGVTPGELDNNNELVVVFPGWFGEAERDVATPVFSDLPNPTDADYKPINTALSLEIGAPGSHHELGIPKADLDAMGDGDRWFSYQIRDKVGNIRTSLAPAVKLKILMNAPATLAAPLVPANADGLITWSDAAPGFQKDGLLVNIPLYTGPAPEDKVLVYWGGVPIGLSPEIGPGPSGGWPDPMFAIGVPFNFVNSTTSWPITLDVTYSIIRNTVPIPPSAPTSVTVDLRTAGGIVDPDPDTPEHENFLPLKVLSSSGAENEIPAGDYEDDATAVVPYLGADGTAIWTGTDTLAVKWGVITVTQPLNPTDINDYQLTIPHATVIGQSSSGAVPVSYSIRRPLGGGVVSEVSSSVTTVQVVNTAALPGGTAGLPLATYPEARLVGSNLVIGRTEGLDGTKIRVPLLDAAGDPLANVSEGDTVDLRFVAVNSRTDSNAAEISSTEVKLSHPLDDADFTRTYYEFDITEEQLKAICYLMANAYITITNPVGPATSPKATVIISVKIENYCTVPTP